MARFRFRLATLLRIREAARDERRGQLAEALRIADDLQARLDELDAEIGDARRQQTVPPGQVDVDRLISAQRYEGALLVDRVQTQAQKDAVEVEIERRRLALVESDRDVRVLEKLREKQQSRHRADEEVRLMKALDEVAARIAAREGAR